MYLCHKRCLDQLKHTRCLQLWETYIRSSGVLIGTKIRYLLPPSSNIISLPNPCALMSVFYQVAVNSGTLQRISGLENGCTVYTCAFWNVLQAVLHTLRGFHSCWPSDPVFLHLCYTLLRERHSHWELHLTLLFFLWSVYGSWANLMPYGMHSESKPAQTNSKKQCSGHE